MKEERRVWRGQVDDEADFSRRATVYLPSSMAFTTPVVEGKEQARLSGFFPTAQPFDLISLYSCLPPPIPRMG